MAEESRELLRPADVSSRLGLTTGRVYQLIREGVIPHVRVGNAIRIPRQAWEVWVADHNQAALTSIKRR